jgi:hypothetical protein
MIDHPMAIHHHLPFANGFHPIEEEEKDRNGKRR